MMMAATMAMISPIRMVSSLKLMRRTGYLRSIIARAGRFVK